MGESACLMQQPFCYASGIPSDASNESNPIHALGQSVSFGRFVSESLAWEKWSSFSSNPKRYVEEAERYSRPGSVAQKKAFFEAHYKKLAAKKAAALLEQQANNAASNNVSEQIYEAVVDDVNTCDSQTASPDSKVVVNEEQDLNALKTKPDTTICTNEYHLHSSSNMQTDISDPEKEQKAFVQDTIKIELPKQLEDNDTYKEDSMKIGLPKQLEDNDTYKEIAEKVTRTPLKKWMLKKNSNCDQEVLASKKNPTASSSKLLKESGTSKFISTPAKSTAPISSHKDKCATPMSKKPGVSSAEKKRATPKSLHMPVNFTPIRELNRLTASVMRRFESSRVSAASSKASSKDTSTPLKTPTMTSKNEVQKHASMTPLTEKKRNKTPMDSSVSANNAAGSKWRLLSAEKKMRSPIITSPFSLRTEERAATRKKKLEEKFNADEEQKVQLHTKLKKAETEIRKLRQSFCFKARPLPDFYKERKASKSDINKETMLYPESLKQGRKLAPRVLENKTSLPPQRPSLKNNGSKNFQGKKNELSSHPLTSNSTMNIAHENTSPNIQHGNRNDRN